MKYILISAFLLALPSIATAGPGQPFRFTEVGTKDSDNAALHSSDFSSELHRLETLSTASTLPHLPDKRQGGRSKNLKRKDPNAHFESTGATVNAIEAYEAIIGLGAYFGQGKDVKPDMHWVDGNRNFLQHVAATLTVGKTVAYVCSYGGKQHIDTDTWINQMWAIINSDFQNNAGRPDVLRAAYYSEPSWQAAYGFTNVGTAYCSAKHSRQ